MRLDLNVVERAAEAWKRGAVFGRARTGRGVTFTGPSADDPLKLYVRQIGDGRLLTPAEERELARRKDLGDEDAKRKLIESNLRLVMSITRNYTHADVPLDRRVRESGPDPPHGTECPIARRVTHGERCAEAVRCTRARDPDHARARAARAG